MQALDARLAVTKHIGIGERRIGVVETQNGPSVKTA